MIEAIFFSRFHHEKGPIVVHQVPDGAVLRSTSIALAPLFDFSALAEFIIPRQEFCDAALSISTGSHRILGHPVCISSPRYARNEFIFNLAIVVPASLDAVPYGRVVRRVAQLFREAELSVGFLSEDESARDLSSAWTLDSAVFAAHGDASWQPSPVHAFCEMLMQDLNCYGEAMLPIDTSRVLNATLQSAPGTSPSVRAWHVPLAMQDLRGFSSPLATNVLAPLIDGKRSVAQIAQRADADLSVVQRAVASLAAANMVQLLDILQYGAKYAAGPGIRTILHDPAAQDAAATAVAQSGALVQACQLPVLYASLGNGASLQSWCLEHWSKLHGIDIRSFVTWGLLQGIIYRVHTYAISPNCNKHSEGPKTSEMEAGNLPDLHLERYLHGLHCFDCIGTAHGVSPSDISAKLASASAATLIDK